MGKNRQRGHRSTAAAAAAAEVSSSTKSDGSSAALTEAASAAAAKAASSRSSLWAWLRTERQGLSWVIGCVLMGSVIGFLIGTGHLTAYGEEPTPWRIALGAKIRASPAYQLVSLQSISISWNRNDRVDIIDDPSQHPDALFAVLREAIVRERGGYVHPDLGLLIPAPSGAARGLGMKRSTYGECQMRCIPGVASEKRNASSQENVEFVSKNEDPIYRQEEVLIRVPLAFQMTRKVALDTLIPLLPSDRTNSLHELDDAALLVLLLAHERGLLKASRWLPYILSLPTQPSCGYHEKLRPYMLDSIEALGQELGVDVNGWPNELQKAGQYAHKIAASLTRDYGSYIQTPEAMSVLENVKWALCQVASRATAGSERHGSLRLIPMVDMINHDAAAGGFVELTGKERLEEGDFVDAWEWQSGTFVVRSIRHGRRKPLKQGQELMVNYNVPQYTPLDWIISLGFLPPERWHQWQKIDPVLPRVRRDGPFTASSDATVNDEFLKSLKNKNGADAKKKTKRSYQGL